MSSSTVSITANRSAASLRKPILTGDKKTALDIAGTDVSPASGGESKDLARAGAETVVERSKEATKLRKRTVVKKGRPPWKTAVSVIVKNLGLVLILLLLAQMIRRLAFSHDSVLVSSSDYERRIAEVEAFLKTTTKMIQVQVEIVDRKIDNQVAGLRSELSKRIDDERAVFSNKFSEHNARIERVEQSLTSSHWLSKHEFDEFVEEFKGKKGVDDIGEMKLDEIRAFAREIVEKEISKHAADGLGRVDYAVASGGAMVLKHSEAFNGASSRVRGWFSGNVRSDAVKVLQPSFGQPGECFPLKGDAGFVEIKLRTAIVPEAITLEHVSKSVAFDRSSAPKECKVLGWVHNEQDTQNEHLLTEFVYDLEKSAAQTYNVFNTEGVDPIIVDTIRLQFLSNHGSPTHTCIYRVRVHGYQPSVA
ncbi:hypothetical protein QVD17_12642 [Tagetes erecta]|uniref:SUN domain-containing protein n=1 Tax=Tagetes erecta TaxID=13708 RepID=A0AAD8KVW3_TARER|nr:hypothetical protein QVD17_12642 [Tagetes erecta]